MLKKMMSILLVCMLFLTSCTESVTTTDKPQTIDIGIILPTRDEMRWTNEEKYLTESVKNTQYNFSIMFSQSDPIKERENVEYLIGKGMKVLIICPEDASASISTVKAAKDAGVTVISYDRLIKNTEDIDYFVTFDSENVGRIQAEYLVNKAINKTDQPLYLYTGPVSDNNSYLLFEGAWEVLEPKIKDGTFTIANSKEAEKLVGKPKLTKDEITKIIGQTTTNWDANTAKTIAESDLINVGSDKKGDVFILAPNDMTARSIADTFAVDKNINTYEITGQDAEILAIQYIIDDKQSMTVLKDTRVLSKEVVNMAIDILEGRTPVTTTTYDNNKIVVPSYQGKIEMIDKGNVKEKIINSGYYDATNFKNVIY